MRSSRKRAVVAVAFPKDADALQEMLESIGFSEVICVSDGLSAIRQIQNRPTDLVVADQILPMLDGVELARKIPSMSLNVYPASILLAVSGTSPKNTDSSVLIKPLSREKFLNVAAQIRPEWQKIPERRKVRIEETLDRIGIPIHCGRDYLIRAIEMAWLDGRLVRKLTGRLYPAIAKQFGVDDRHVVRAMRHVIDEAWRSGEMDAQYELFGDTIDARRGSPTLGEMIAQIADILRWEGNA